MKNERNEQEAVLEQAEGRIRRERRGGREMLQASGSKRGEWM